MSNVDISALLHTFVSAIIWLLLTYGFFGNLKNRVEGLAVVALNAYLDEEKSEQREELLKASMKWLKICYRIAKTVSIVNAGGAVIAGLALFTEKRHSTAIIICGVMLGIIIVLGIIINVKYIREETEAYKKTMEFIIYHRSTAAKEYSKELKERINND